MTKESEMKSLIKCWGENIERSGVTSKKYISYVVYRDNFNDMKTYKLDVELDRFDFIEIIFNQCNKKTTLEFHCIADDSESVIKEVEWGIVELLSIISCIEK